MGLKLDLLHVEGRIGVPFPDAGPFSDFIQSALTEERLTVTPDNLRFLIMGQSLLRLLASEHMFRTRHDRRESSMTPWRDAFLQKGLHEVAVAMGLNMMMDGSGTRPIWRPRKQRVLATKMAFGALLLEQGFRACHTAFTRCAVATLDETIKKTDDPLNAIQEMALLRLGLPAYFEPLEEDGQITVGCFVGYVLVAKGSGPDVGYATQAAAVQAVECIGEWTPLVLESLGKRLRKRLYLLYSEPVIPSGMESVLSTLEQRLDAAFSDRDLLYQALIHKSLHYEHPSSYGHNERLEFLGDAVLEFTVTEFLLDKFSGDINRIFGARDSLVANRKLADVAVEKLGLHGAVRFGLKELDNFERFPDTRRKALADAFEAVLGTVYLDRGIGTARMIVDAIIHSRMSAFIEEGRTWSERNPKLLLNNLLSQRHLPRVSYEFSGREGPDDDPIFTCNVVMGEETLGSGTGRNKKSAEISAARVALEELARRKVG